MHRVSINAKRCVNAGKMSCHSLIHQMDTTNQPCLGLHVVMINHLCVESHIGLYYYVPLISIATWTINQLATCKRLCFSPHYTSAATAQHIWRRRVRLH